MLAAMDKSPPNLKLVRAADSPVADDGNLDTPVADSGSLPATPATAAASAAAVRTEMAVRSPLPSTESPRVLEGEQVTITGTLASMTHEQAFAQIREHGGQPTPHISRHSTLLIIGEEGWPLEEDGKPSLKLQQATQLMQEGLPLRIVSESDWLRMLQLHTEVPEVRRLYTPAMLSQVLKIPVQVIRSWERAGLIRAEKKVFRLPYFSYQEVTTARRVSELLESGVTQQQLTRSLQVLKKFLPEPGRVLEQLELLSDHRRLVIRDQHGFLDPHTRQRLFDFSPSGSAAQGQPEALPRDSELADEAADVISGRFLRLDAPREKSKTTTDGMVEGCRQAGIADSTAAIRCFRQALRIRPDDAEAHFYLADSLYRLGKLEAALERYLAAIEHDPEYLEAWNQIGCVYAELNKWNDSLLAFDEALKVYPDFAESHWHKAETLRQIKRIPEAIEHWQAYLELDHCGPWAELAFQRLEQAGVIIPEADE